MSKNVFAGVGFAQGEKKDSAKVGAQAVESAIDNMKKQGGKLPGSFGLLFCSVKYDLSKLVAAAHEKFAGTPWAGCTTVGELSSKGFTTESCVAMIVSSEYIHVGIGVGDDASKDPQKAGETAAKAALKNMRRDKEVDPYIQYLAMKKKDPEQIIKMTPYTGILLAPGPTMTQPISGDDVILGITNVLGNNVPIVGGAAGDDLNMSTNHQFADGKVYDSAVVFMLGLFNVEKEIKVEHGFEPTNDVLVVNKSKDYLVQEINGKPAAQEIGKILGTKLFSMPKSGYIKDMMKFAMPSALKLFKKMGFDMTEKSIQGLISTPFGISDIYGNFWLRVPYQAQDDSVVFINKIPEQTVMRKMQIKPEVMIKTEKSIIKDTISNLKMISFVIQFDCCNRRILLGEENIKDVMNNNKKLLDGIPLIGFYSMGEYGFKNAINMNFSNTNVVFAVGDELVSR